MSDQPPLPPNVTKRLVLVKYQLARARLQLRVPTEFGAWGASLALHDAAEICVLAIADFREVERNRKRFLRDYPTALEQKVSGTTFFDRALMNDLEELRDPAKHRGDFPSVTVVRALYGRVETSLDRNCLTYIGKQLSAVSLAEMIEATDVRAFVAAAEEKLLNGKYTDAIVALKRAWHLAIPRFADRLPDTLSLSLPSFLESSAFPEKAVRQIEQWWGTIRPTLQLLVLGVDVRRYGAFEDLGPTISVSEGGHANVYLTGQERVLHTVDTATFCLTFVLDTIVRLQEIERVPGQRSYYVLRINDEAKYFDARDPSNSSVGLLQPGTEIPAARLGHGKEEEWFWDDETTGKTFRIPFDAAEIIRAIPMADHERMIREQLMNRGEP